MQQLEILAFVLPLKSCFIATQQTIDIIAEKSVISKVPYFKICHSLRGNFKLACSARRVLSEYTSHTPGSFREYGGLDEVSGDAEYYISSSSGISVFRGSRDPRPICHHFESVNYPRIRQNLGSRVGIWPFLKYVQNH